MKKKNQILIHGAQTQIYVVGFIALQNILLTHFIEEKTGLKCNYHQGEDKPFIVDKNEHQPILILWDCINFEQDEPWAELGLNLKSNFNKTYVALFNVSPDQEILEEAISRGLHGIFYKNDSPSTIIKGIHAILNGELWFSRNALSRTLFKKMKTIRINKQIQYPLTCREKEILGKLSEGVTNAEIADDLCISIHTVKTHLYNMYEKIDVSNRLQASLWAAKNL